MKRTIALFACAAALAGSRQEEWWFFLEAVKR